MINLPRIFGLVFHGLAAHLHGRGTPRFRDTQVLECVYKISMTGPQPMAKLSQVNGDRLGEAVIFQIGQVLCYLMKGTPDGKSKR